MVIEDVHTLHKTCSHLLNTHAYTCMYKQLRSLCSLQLLLPRPGCVHFSYCSQPNCVRFSCYSWPDCIHFSCCSPIIASTSDHILARIRNCSPMVSSTHCFFVYQHTRLLLSKVVLHFNQKRSVVPQYLSRKRMRMNLNLLNHLSGLSSVAHP